MKKRIRWGGIFLCNLMIILHLGCAPYNRTYYPMHALPAPPDEARIVSANPPSVSLDFEFQTNGIKKDAVSEKYFLDVFRTLSGSGLFSAINLAGAKSDTSMSIVMNNYYDSLASAAAQGAASALTLGVVGGKVTDKYKIETKFNSSKTNTTFAKQYEVGIISTSGLIHPGVEGIEPRSTGTEAFKEILNRVLLNWLYDLQKEGLLI